MLKKTVPPLGYNEEIVFEVDEIEIARPISQDQLSNAKMFNSRYNYAQTLNKNIAYLEVGVAYGYSAQMFIDATNASSADLVDLYNDAFQIINTGGARPDFGSKTHEEYIKDKFSYHPNVNTIKGNAKDVLPTLNKKYDFIFLDMEAERFVVRKFLSDCSKIINVNGIIGMTSYTNHDCILYGGHFQVYQSINEFLHFNKNWSVDAIILEGLGFHDIYIKKNS